MQFEFTPVSLTELVLIPLTLISSLVVAYFTSKREMKRFVFERRIEAYASLFDYLRRLKRDHSFRSSQDAVQELSQLETDIKLLGTNKLISIIADLYAKLSQSIEAYDSAKRDAQQQAQNEYNYYIEEKGMSPIEAQLYQESIDEEEGDQNVPYVALLLSNEAVDQYTSVAIREMRRSLHLREFRPAVWIRRTKLYDRLSWWS